MTKNLTRRDAARILHQVWGAGECLTKGQVELIEPVMTDNETMFGCLGRVSGIDLSDIKPMDNGTVRARASAAMMQMDIADALRHKPGGERWKGLTSDGM